MHRKVWKSESSKWAEQTVEYLQFTKIYHSWCEATHFTDVIVGNLWYFEVRVYVISSDDLNVIQPLQQLTTTHHWPCCCIFVSNPIYVIQKKFQSLKKKDAVYSILLVYARNDLTWFVFYLHLNLYRIWGKFKSLSVQML